jgi:hypothetical protein
MPRPTRPPAAVTPPGSRQESGEILRIPVLAEGKDPGRTMPAPLAVRDRLLVDRRLVGDHDAERLFAYDVTPANARRLRGLAAPGDRIVFRRGGRIGPDRICAVRTPAGIVLSRVRLKGRTLLLVSGEGERDTDGVEAENVEALPGAVAGTHVLLIRR